MDSDWTNPVLLMRGDMQVDTESALAALSQAHFLATCTIPYYLRKDANEIPGNLAWPTLEERRLREVRQRLNDALDRVEKHPDAKVAMPFWRKALPMIYGKKP